MNENAYRNIMVVSRSTRQCRKSVETGISLAKAFGASLTVLHVIHDPFSLEGWNLPVPSLEAEYRKMVDDIRQQIHRRVAAAKEIGLEVNEQIREGVPHKEILQAVEQEKIDLVLMTAHDEGRLEHIMFGRTTDEIVRRLPADLLLVKEDR
jgi:nucleotide-binding universal stress UspA family protein